MKKLVLGFAALCCSISVTPVKAASHSGKHPVSIHAKNVASDCVFFRLDGVSVADSSVNLLEWFGLSKSHYNYNELFAMLMTSKATGLPIEVSTQGGGATACGAAAVSVVAL